MFHCSQEKICWYTCTHYWCSDPDNRVSGGNKRPLKKNVIIYITNSIMTQIWTKACPHLHLLHNYTIFNCLENLKIGKILWIIILLPNHKIWICYRNLTRRTLKIRWNSASFLFWQKQISYVAAFNTVRHIYPYLKLNLTLNSSSSTR